MYRTPTALLRSVGGAAIHQVRGAVPRTETEGRCSMFYRDSKSSDSGSSTSSAPAAMPSSVTAKAMTGVPSIISPDLTITGDLKSNGDIQIDGTVEGDIDSRLLTIGQGAEVRGSVVAETVRISGKVEGQVKAKNVTLDKTAKVIGDITHESLTMEAGAQFEGRVSRIQSASNGSGAKVASLHPASSANGGASSSTSTVQSNAF